VHLEDILNQQELSNMEYVNPVLLLILIAQICLGICAWQSPRFLRRTAAHLLTRADVLDVCRRESARSMKVWLNELGLEDPECQSCQAFAKSSVLR